MRSPVTSRSNWAKDSSTFSMRRPIEVVVLNCWVTETNDTPWASNSSISLAKSASERVRRSTLYHDLDLAGPDVGEQTLQSRPVKRSAGIAAVVVAGRQQPPAFVLLALDVGRAGLALSVERVELLLQAFL